MDPTEQQHGSLVDSYITCHRPTQICVQNLSCTIGDKDIIKDVSAVFRPGRLSVIVGPSGSGKTTLLSLIAGLSGSQPKDARLGGNILYNGTTIPPERMRKIVGFVFQDDVILETMTVKEAIDMSTRLRVNLPSIRRRQAVTERMLDLSQLHRAENVMIGSPDKKGISGGERKRTAMAMELVSNPSVLILDEPTSGLDSYNAWRVVALLQRLAHKNGRTVVATLHQPSSEIFHMIDDLYVLHDGQLVYGGDAQELIPYFAEAGYRFHPYSNPLDVLFMDVLNQIRQDELAAEVHFMSDIDPRHIPLERLAAYYKQSEIYRRNVIDVPLLTQGVTKGMHRFKAKRWSAYMLLIVREVRNIRRDFRIGWTRLFQTLVLAGFIAAAYWNTKYAPVPKLYQNLSGALFFITTNAFFSSFQNVLPVFAHEKRSFAREHSQGYYGIGSYFFAKISVELPFTVMFPILTSVIVYWSLGLRPGFNHFLVFTTILQIVSLSGFSIGLMAAALFDDLAVAQAISILFLLPMMLFAGLVLNVATVPAFLRWLQWVSPMRYGFSSLMTNQFDGWDAPGAQQYYNALNADTGFSILVNMIILSALFLGGLFLAYLALVRVVLQKERSMPKLSRVFNGIFQNIKLARRPVPPLVAAPIPMEQMV